MNILQALKTENTRVSTGDRWLVWGADDLWVVYEKKYGARKTKTVYYGNDEEKAVKFLLGKEGE